MSEKVTFQELIDSIAEETNNSKKFTHDFLKDLVAVINTGLEQDGSVNIAGFGKFKLRRMEEREGYNPQTGEKMTIDAHNKVVFKPYKALRELVNAPYSDLESELLEEDQDEQETDSQEVIAETSKLDEASGEEEKDSEPTGPPPAVKSEEETASEIEEMEVDEDEEAPWEGREADAAEDEDEKAAEAQKEDPFGISEPELEDSEVEIEEDPVEKEGDVVEFKEPEEEERDPSPLDRHLSKVKEKQDQEGSEEEPDDEAEESSELQSRMPPEPEEEEEKETETESEPAEEPVPAMSATVDHESEEEESKNSLLPMLDKDRAPTWIWGVAAVIGLLIIVLAIVYIGSGNGAEEPAQTVATAQDQPQQQTEEVVEEPVTGDTESAEGTSAQTETGQASGAQLAGQEETQEQPLQLQTSDYVERSVARGQTLWGLAEREYEDPYLWPWIYDANKATIRNPDIILVGQTLSIPVPDEPNNGLSSADSLEVAVGYVETYRWYKDHGHDQAKYYLWAAKIYDRNVFDHITHPIDAEDLAFANRVR